jgi:hypothetical protein
LDSPDNKERLKHRALSLASIASRHFFEGEPSMAVTACGMLADLGPMVRQAKIDTTDVSMPWLRIIQGAAQCEGGRRAGTVQPCEGFDVELPCNLVYSVLKAMSTFPSDNNDRVFEAVSNSLVRRVLFVTGAVDMAGCPPADRGEAVFIGRSNVGKSSLVNMVGRRLQQFLFLYVRELTVISSTFFCRLQTENLSHLQANARERLNSSTSLP